MSPSERIKLFLDLDLASEPIEGEVHAADGLQHSFVGWLGLTSALERAAACGDTPPIHHPQGDWHVP